jgi:methylenetetrahydrofolate reductase (NADPH)
MEKGTTMGMLDSIRDGKFTIIAEFTPHNGAEVENIARTAKGLARLNEKYAPHGIVFAGVSMTQNPGGQLSYDHLAALAILKEQGFPESLEVVPHVTGKDMNVDALTVFLAALAERGVRSILALTGDASLGARSVFEVEALGLLQLVRKVNVNILKKAKTSEFDTAPIITAGAAVSPFKYTEGSLAMQYIKASKKIREGAGFLTCQSGWDSERSEHLAKTLGGNGTPLIGNVLVVNGGAAKYMQTLAGCVVTDAFLAKLSKEKEPDYLLRASQQLAMFRALGYGGVALGRPGEFKSVEEIEKIVDGALAIQDWREFKANITFPMPVSPTPPIKRTAGFSRAVHHAVFDAKAPLRGVAKALMSPFNAAAEREGALYRIFKAQEEAGKGLMYECEHCGDCFLPENNFICTWGGCEKGLNNPPCGDADARGYCGNNANRICVGERLYARALARNELDAFKKIVLPSRKPALAGTASLLNNMFGRDHTTRENPLKGSGLIQVGEMLHGAIPLAGAAMRHIQRLGENGYKQANRGLFLVEHLIRSQADQGADYIRVNVDVLGADAAAAMRQYVRLVHEYGGGTPPCVDSANPEVLLAGLAEWFSVKDAKPPLVNALAYARRDGYKAIVDLRRQHEFSAVCLLTGPDGPLESADEMVAAAKEMFRAMTAAGFRPGEIFFDTSTVGLTSDGCVGPAGVAKPSHTYNSFNALGRIGQDPDMRGVHCMLNASSWAVGVKKRRVGHLRAFIAVAQKHGLDAVVAEVENKFGLTPGTADLMGLVETFASLDGGKDSAEKLAAKMDEARQKSWI